MVFIKNITKLQLYFNFCVIYNFLIYKMYNPIYYCSIKNDIYDSLIINSFGVLLSLAILFYDENNNTIIGGLLFLITTIKLIYSLFINQILYDLVYDNNNELLDTLVVKTFISTSYYLFLLGTIKILLLSPFFIFER